MNGIATRRSRYGFDETIERLQIEIESRGASAALAAPEGLSATLAGPDSAALE